MNNLKKVLIMILMFSVMYASSVSISARGLNYVDYQQFKNLNQNSEVDNLEIIVDEQTIELFPVDYGEYTEYYFYLDGKKIKALTVYKEDEIAKKYGLIDFFATNASSPTFTEFKNAFMVRNNSTESIKIENDVINQGAAIVGNVLYSYITKSLPWWAGAGIGIATTEIAKVVVKYPADSWVIFNLVEYNNRNCSQYLSGRSFNLENNKITSPTLYDWRWSENPQLGIVNTACKLENQTYPFPDGGGSSE